MLSLTTRYIWCYITSEIKTWENLVHCWYNHRPRHVDPVCNMPLQALFEGPHIIRERWEGVPIIDSLTEKGSTKFFTAICKTAAISDNGTSDCTLLTCIHSIKGAKRCDISIFCCRDCDEISSTPKKYLSN